MNIQDFWNAVLTQNAECTALAPSQKQLYSDRAVK